MCTHAANAGGPAGAHNKVISSGQLRATKNQKTLTPSLKHVEDALLLQVTRRAPVQHAVLARRCLLGVPENLGERFDVARKDLPRYIAL
jgi:hypothetical protein